MVARQIDAEQPCLKLKLWLQDTTGTWLPDAVDAGARICTSTKATQILRDACASPSHSLCLCRCPLFNKATALAKCMVMPQSHEHAINPSLHGPGGACPMKLVLLDCMMFDICLSLLAPLGAWLGVT